MTYKEGDWVVTACGDSVHRLCGARMVARLLRADDVGSDRGWVMDRPWPPGPPTRTRTPGAWIVRLATPEEISQATLVTEVTL